MSALLGMQQLALSLPKERIDGSTSQRARQAIDRLNLGALWLGLCSPGDTKPSSGQGPLIVSALLRKLRYFLPHLRSAVAAAPPSAHVRLQ